MRSRRPRKVYLSIEELETRFVPSGMLLYSDNWSGYALAANIGSVSYVGGVWNVPSVSGSSNAYSATWVGIDGLRSQSVEQVGTEADYVNGQAQYYAWYEMYPMPSVIIPKPVQPGDTIFASVAYAGGSGFTLTISSSAWETPFTKTVSAPAQRSSAEWVVEAPSAAGSGALPLADFGSQSISGATATVSKDTGTINTVAHTKVDQIDMTTPTGTFKDTTSPLGPTGSSFTVTFASSGSASTTTTALTQTKVSKPGSTTHDVNSTPTVVVLITVPTANANPILTVPPIPLPTTTVSTPLPPSTVPAPTTLSAPVLIDPFVGTQTSDILQVRDNGRDGGGAAPAGPAQAPGNLPAPTTPAAPMAPMAQPQSRLDNDGAPAGISVLQTDGEPAMLQDDTASAHELADASERTVEVAGIVLTVALGTSAGVSLGDREARKKPITL